MLSAKPVFMEVRPFQVANLCFEVGGILGQSFAELGTDVVAFDFGSFYKDLLLEFGLNLNEPNINTAGERLFYNSQGIDAKTFLISNPNVITHLPGPHWVVLAALRAEPVRAALDKAVNVRANAYITKYSSDARGALIGVMRKVFAVKGDQINTLSNLSDSMTNALNAAYVKDAERTGAVTSTTTQTEVTSIGGIETTTVQLPKSQDAPTTVATQVSTEPPGTPQEKQITTTKNIEFRAPIFENQARNQRAQLGLGQEIISFTAQSCYQDRLNDVYTNELAAIDADVKRMMVAYLNTILMSPIDGIVTGVYKNPGDWVSAGEPVFRVENNAVVLIVANVVCRGPVLIGSTLSITTTLFDGSGLPVSVSAAIVSARGRGDDDQWEVIGKVSNTDAAGNKIFPLGYRFDNDITQVSIV